MTRKICVITGSRAEYGLLRHLLQAIEARGDLKLQLVVTGMHLVQAFGFTRNEIVADGFAIDAEVDMLLAGDSPLAAAKSLGLGTIGLAEALARLTPDAVVLLGDRFEALAAAQATMMLNIPLAHISGGDVTQGAIDDAIRHSITKMADLHFVYAEEYARRVIQLGEQPNRVFNVGALGADAIRHLDLIPKDQLEADLGLALDPPPLLVTYHPATLSDQDQAGSAQALLDALDDFPQIPVVMTGVNADPGHDAVGRLVHAYAAARPGRAVLVQSLGQRRYLSVMALSAAVVGNSSSGIIEAPMMGVPTVNMGDRQKGRLRAASIIDCPPDRAAIRAAIDKAVAPQFRAFVATLPNPYGDGRAAENIARVLAETNLTNIRCKAFHDLP